MMPYLFEKVEPCLGLSSVVRPQRIDRPQDGFARSVLEERFPHVVQAIQMLWGHPELEAHFRHLTMDERGGRQGFPEEAWAEIHFLMRLHQGVFPCAVR